MKSKIIFFKSISYKIISIGCVIYSIFISFAFITFFCCNSYNSGIDIYLPKNQHLENVEAGWWIKKFGLNYKFESKHITRLLHEQLTKKAILLDERQDKNNSVITTWKYVDGNKPIIVEEQISTDSDGNLDYYFTFKYDPPGIIWSSIIPLDYMRLKANRKYEHAVTIHSELDQAGLFLFGWGNYCVKICFF